MEILSILGNLLIVKDYFMLTKNTLTKKINNNNLKNSIDNFKSNIEFLYRDYSKELELVFDENNLIQIEDICKSEVIYNVQEKLKKFIKDECLNFKIPIEKADEIANLFYKIFTEVLKENSPEIYEKLTLGNKLSGIKEEVKKITEVKYKSINDIEEELKRSFSRDEERFKTLTLDFFNYNDKEFNLRLKNSLKDKEKCIYIEGPSKEEVFYNILYILKEEKYNNEDILILESYEEWEKLAKNKEIKEKILIANFYNQNIKPNINNINIFIYSVEEQCIKNTKINLYRRLRKNLEEKLKNLGYDYNEIFQILNKTNGVYAGLKRIIFLDRLNKPKWTNELLIDGRIDILKKAILFGKWEVKDKIEIENKFNINYEFFINQLKSVINIEEPLLIENLDKYFLASPYEAWAYIKEYISNEEFDKFVDRVIDIICEIEEEYVENFKRENSIYVSEKYKYSETLKKGLLRSIILYSPGENSNVVKRIFENIFNSQKEIEEEIKWAYLSKYILYLCEISPEETLKQLKFAIKNSSKLLDLFKKIDNNEFNPNYYTYYIWAIEILLQIDKTGIKALELLLEINDFNLNYKLDNSPASTLRHVFCVWKRDVKISKEDILLLAEKFILKYDLAWDIIRKEIPTINSVIVGDLHKPKYINYLKNDEEITIDDYNYLVKGYINILLKSKKIHEKIESLLEHNFLEIIDELKIKEEFENILKEGIKKGDDLYKLVIQNKIREIIYKNRLYQKNLNDDYLETIYNEIRFEDKKLEYKYLFDKNVCNLINPATLGEKEYRYINEKKVQEIIEKKFKEFKEKEYSYLELAKLNLENDKIFGKYIFKIYSNNKLNKEILKKLIQIYDENKAYIGYIGEFYLSYGKNGLEEVLEYLKEIKAENNLKLEVLLLETLNLEENTEPLIEKLQEFKEKYWKVFNRNYHENEKTIRYIIKNLLEYKNPNIVEELSYYLKFFTGEELLNYLEKIQIEKIDCRLDSYSSEIIFEKIYNYYNNKIEDYLRIAKIELYFRKICDINSLKCYMYLLKKDPIYYAEILNIIYKKKNEDEYIQNNDSDSILAKNLYKMYWRIKFCPCTYESENISQEELKNWVNSFKNILKNQNQEFLYEQELAKIFANSPKGEDGYCPHEAIRDIIEEFDEEELEKFKLNYSIEIFNQRGAYTPDDGETENKLSEDYKKISENLRSLYPNTSSILYYISDSYNKLAIREKERAIYE